MLDLARVGDINHTEEIPRDQDQDCDLHCHRCRRSFCRFREGSNARRDRAEAVVETNGHSFGQARVVGQGMCWVPSRDQNDDEYGADTRGLGYWGSCREKGAVPTK